MRNVRCKRYSKCLDEAIQKGVDMWTCKGCERRNDIDPILSDLIGESLLLFAIFRPEFYRLYRQAEKIQDKEKLKVFQEQNRRGYENAPSVEK